LGRYYMFLVGASGAASHARVLSLPRSHERIAHEQQHRRLPPRFHG